MSTLNNRPNKKVVRQRERNGRFAFGCVSSRQPNVAPPTKLEKPCIVWGGRKSTTTGYGCITWEGQDVDVHRFLWEQVKGPIRKGKHVLHRCDNRPCMELGHLFIGSAGDNVRDCIRKGRTTFGKPGFATAGRQRLTPKSVNHLRALKWSGLGPKRISQVTGVPIGTVRDTVYRYTWRHIC